MPPAAAQLPLQGGAIGSRSPDREEWATIAAGVLPFVLPQEHSGTRKEQVVGMRDGSNLVATCHADLPIHRQVPAANPTGTCMPPASIRSMMAAAAKATPQPINTSQPQSETQVYPFSQCKQVVTESNTLDDQESSTLLPTGTLSMNDQDSYPDGDRN